MHLEPVTPNGPWREIYAIDRCQGCGQLFGPGRFSIGWLHCDCGGTVGHRTFRCRACRFVSMDPPHDEAIVIAGGDAYSMGS